MAQRQKDIQPPVTLQMLKNHLLMLTDDFDQQLEMDLRAAVAKSENYINGVIWHGVQTVSVPFVNTVEISEPTAVINQVKVDGQQVEFIFVNGILSVEGSGKVLEYTLETGYMQEDCPVDIQMAILLIAAKYFNSPVDSVEQLPTASQHLLHPYKRYNI